MDVILEIQTKTPWAVIIPILETRQLTQNCYLIFPRVTQVIPIWVYLMFMTLKPFNNEMFQ